MPARPDTRAWPSARSATGRVDPVGSEGTSRTSVAVPQIGDPCGRLSGDGGRDRSEGVSWLVAWFGLKRAPARGALMGIRNQGSTRCEYVYFREGPDHGHGHKWHADALERNPMKWRHEVLMLADTAAVIWRTRYDSRAGNHRLRPPGGQPGRVDRLLFSEVLPAGPENCPRRQSRRGRASDQLDQDPSSGAWMSLPSQQKGGNPFRAPPFLCLGPSFSPG